MRTKKSPPLRSSWLSLLRTASSCGAFSAVPTHIHTTAPTLLPHPYQEQHALTGFKKTHISNRFFIWQGIKSKHCSLGHVKCRRPRTTRGSCPSACGSSGCSPSVVPRCTCTTHACTHAYIHARGMRRHARKRCKNVLLTIVWLFNVIVCRHSCTCIPSSLRISGWGARFFHAQSVYVRIACMQICMHIRSKHSCMPRVQQPLSHTHS